MSGIAKKIGVALVVIAAVVVGINALDTYNKRPQKVTSFESISLGASMDEVAYALGQPTSVARLEDWELKDGTIWKDVVTDVPKQDVEKHKQRFKGYVYWKYEGYSDRRIDVDFDKETKVVTSIGCYVNPDVASRGPCWVNGISVGSSEGEVTETLGQPTRSSIDANSNVKTLEYDNWNMEVLLSKRAVYYIKVHAKKL
jgi:hypothetical protein